MRSLSWIPCAAALTLPATAQLFTVYTLSGDSAGDALGRSAVSVDDLDGDGVRDLAVGSPGDPIRQVRLFSGATGQFLFALNGQLAGDGYGSSLAAVGDIDGDGVTELAVAAPNGSYVELVSLPTQTRLWTWSGAVTQVSRAGDVSGDGTREVLALRSGGGSSALVAISGANGASGLTLTFPTNEWRFLDGGGDANGDGRADVILGNPFWPAGSFSSTAVYDGRASVYSGANGALLHEKIGSLFLENTGWGVSWLDDLDGDERNEFAAGIPGDIWSADPGLVRVWSGASGAIQGTMNSVTPGFGFGTGIVDAGDLDGDGKRDLLVARGASSAQVYGYSGDSKQHLFSLQLTNALLAFPAPVFGALGDVDGNGSIEVFSGDPSDTPEGRVGVFGKCDSPLNYCVAAPNSQYSFGASISWGGSTSVSANAFTLKAFSVPNDMPGIFLYSAGKQQLPFGNGSLCVGGGGAGVFRILPAMANHQQAASGLTLDFTQPPFSGGAGQITPGSTWYFQFWYRDNNAPPAKFNLTNGLRVNFCP